MAIFKPCNCGIRLGAIENKIEQMEKEANYKNWWTAHQNMREELSRIVVTAEFIQKVVSAINELQLKKGVK